MKESSCIKRGAFIGGSPQYAESEMMMPLTGLVSPTDSESSPTDPPEIPPIDTHASRTWHFPLNCTKRQYQYDIAKQSLHSNTLIILPAGLGKTFIASVVMYNFSRWFPSGKIVFLAPTRPLVTQQLDAMMNLVEVDPLRTAEITGAQSPTQRQQLWMEKSLFFMTPQILQNDLISGICPNNQLVLIVFDEAHRALGSHAYCEVVRLLCPSGRAPWWTRILALTATPATNIKIIQQIVSSLLISTIITRTEDSEDVKPYVHERAIEIVTVAECVEARFVRSQFEKYILSPNIEKLVQICTISERDPSRLSAFHLIRDRDSFRRKCSFFNRRSIGTAEGLFATLISLYHAYDLLIFHGLIAFKNFLTKLPDENAAIKSRLRHELDSNTSFVQLIAYIEAQLSIPTFVSHSKLAILEEKIVQHFMKSKDDNVETLAIVLSQFEDSVHEIVSQISRHSPLLRVMSFVGQSRVSGQHVSSSRKEQIQVLNKFKTSSFNVLVSTCIVEGLDIRDIDLIICYDVQSSPTKILQKVGHTACHRKGKILMLLSEGKEEHRYLASVQQHNSTMTALTRPESLFLFYKPDRIILETEPICVERQFSIQSSRVAHNQLPTKKHQRSDESPLPIIYSVPTPLFHQVPEPNFIKFMNYLRYPSSTFNVPHSSTSNLFCKLLREFDELEIPSGRTLDLIERNNTCVTIDIKVSMMNAINEMNHFVSPQRIQPRWGDYILYFDEFWKNVPNIELDIPENFFDDTYFGESSSSMIFPMEAKTRNTRIDEISSPVRPCKPQRRICPVVTTSPTQTSSLKQSSKQMALSKFVDCEAICSELGDSGEGEETTTSLAAFIDDRSDLSLGNLSDSSSYSEAPSSDEMMAFYRRTACQSQATNQFQTRPKQFATGKISKLNAHSSSPTQNSQETLDIDWVIDSDL